MRAGRLAVWPPLPPGAHVAAPVAPLPFPLADDRWRLFARGRHAIYHGVRALGLGPGDQVLMPAYHHGSEIEGLARAGIGCRWYEGDERLEPVEPELDALLAPSVRALYLIHYLGFPQDAARWRRWCDARGVLLIEDAAQAWLATSEGRPVGSWGDLAMFCLYKTIGIPEGAALVSTAPPPAPAPDPRWGAWALARRHGAWLSQRSVLATAVAAQLRRPPRSLADEVALGDAGAGAWGATGRLLPRLADPGAAAARRANYALLLETLAEDVPAPFERLPAGASPFAFPVRAASKEQLLRRLARAGVRGMDLWSAPHPSLPEARFPGVAGRRATTVGLPVHQELHARDLDRIARAARSTGRRRTELRVEQIADLAAARGEWSQLAQQTGNVFATWEWAATWWRHFGGGRPLHLSACRSAGRRLVAILPIYRSATVPLRTLRFVGHGPADELGPVCAPGDRPLAAAALRRALDGLGDGWDLFVGERLARDEAWHRLADATVLKREASPVLGIHGASWDDFLAGRSANLREQVRRRERRLARAHDLRFRLADDPRRLDGDLDVLFALHEARFGDQSRAFATAHRAFHRDFAARALELGWLRLWFAEVDGRPVAAWYGFRFAGADSFYQSGRDPGWERWSVGFVLLVHTIREAFRDGMREYRFLRGDEPYKSRFADRDTGLETLALAPHAAGQVAISAATALAHWPPGRRWMVRTAGRL